MGSLSLLHSVVSHGRIFCPSVHQYSTQLELASAKSMLGLGPAKSLTRHFPHPGNPKPALTDGAFQMHLEAVVLPTARVDSSIRWELRYEL